MKLTERVWYRITSPGDSGTCWLKDTGGGNVSINRAAKDFGDTIDVGSSEETAAGLDRNAGLLVRSNESPVPLGANTSYEVFYALLIESTTSDRSAEIIVDAGPSGIGGQRANLNTPGLTAFGEAVVERFDPLCGWVFTYNINPGIVSVTQANGGTAIHVDDIAVLSSGTDPDGEARIETIRSCRYIPGFGGVARFTAIFGAPRADSAQLIGLGDNTDGLFYGYDGLQFGILRRRGGVDYWTYIADWNGNRIQDFNPQAANVYQIRHKWIGAKVFDIEDVYGRTVPVHVIRYANTYTETSLVNPSLPLSAQVINTGNTTPVVLKTASAMAGIHGDVSNEALSISQAEEFVGPIAPDTQVPIIAFRMGPTYIGKANRLYVEAVRYTSATDGVKPITFRVFSGGIVSGGTWLHKNVNLSPLEYNKTITSYTPGEQSGTFGYGAKDSYPVDLTTSKFRLYANQQVVVTAQTSSVAADIVVGVNWKAFV